MTQALARGVTGDRLTVGVAARLSRYLQVLTQAKKMGKERISSQEISVGRIVCKVADSHGDGARYASGVSLAPCQGSFRAAPGEAGTALTRRKDRPCACCRRTAGNRSRAAAPHDPARLRCAYRRLSAERTYP